ncbi:MAG: ArsR/SmtB family transcription factor [Bacteroidota bacterium]
MREARLFKAEFFKALANPLRIAILDALRDGELTVSELMHALEVEQSALSQQLSVLRAKNLIQFRKAGNFVHYSVSDPEIFRLLDDAWKLFQNHLIDLHRPE